LAVVTAVLVSTGLTVVFVSFATVFGTYLVSVFAGTTGLV